MTSAMGCLHASMGLVTGVSLDHQPSRKTQLRNAHCMQRIETPVANRFQSAQRTPCRLQVVHARGSGRGPRLPLPRAVKRSKEDTTVKPKQKADNPEDKLAGPMCVFIVQLTCPPESETCHKVSTSTLSRGFKQHSKHRETPALRVFHSSPIFC